MRPDLSDILINAGQFDANWYAATYPDVPLSGLDPAAHYLATGHLLGRGVSAAHPKLGDLPGLAHALTARPEISYCIPVMNRPGDIRGTLAANLAAARPHRAQVEFVVMFFDQDTVTHDWIRTTFAEDLADGHLRLILSDALDSWHFGKAKNAFRDVIRGRVYSSLDGDNFVTSDETSQLRDLSTAHPEGFVFHHFSGAWGDGSCGRVSLPATLYRRIGYDPTMLPRQYDEVDMILSTLQRAPDVPLVRYALGTHGLSSSRSATFMAEVGLDNPVIELPVVPRRPALNPHSETYIQSDPSLSAMQDFNQAQCFLKNATSPRLRANYLQMAFTARHRVVDALSGPALCDALFHSVTAPAPAHPDDLCLFACVNNDAGYLPAFHAHYSALGVTRFCLVDDGSDRPVTDVLPYDNVHVVSPKTGHFASAKGLWLEALMKAVLQPGMWALTADADEFLDLPVGFASLTDVIGSLTARGATCAPGLLIDMLPTDGATLAALSRGATEFATLFPDHMDSRLAPDPAYLEHHSVAWGFGPYAALSWQIDARHQAFGSFDSLRKLPLFQYRQGQHLDQGLHTLHYTDGTTPPGSEIWETDLVLPIRHYTLAKLFSDEGRDRLEERTGGATGPKYHDRTAGNVDRLLDLGPEGALARLLALPRRPYSEGAMTRIDPRPLRKKDAA